jgi:hypothetical protein
LSLYVLIATFAVIMTITVCTTVVAIAAVRQADSTSVASVVRALTGLVKALLRGQHK